MSIWKCHPDSREHRAKDTGKEAKGKGQRTKHRTNMVSPPKNLLLFPDALSLEPEARSLQGSGLQAIQRNRHVPKTLANQREGD
jgi:hypothetical protein